MAKSTDRNRKFALVTTLLLMLGSLVVPLSVHGESPDEYTFVTFYDWSLQYEPGDMAIIEMHFFHLEKYIDPTSINVTIKEYGWFGNDIRYVEEDINSLKQETGIYKLELTLQEGDFSKSYSSNEVVIVIITATFEVIGQSEDIQLEEEIELEGVALIDFEIAIESDKRIVEPGESVIFTVTFTNLTTKVDPVEEDFDVTFTVGTTSEMGNLSMLTKKSAGIYTYIYEVPTNVIVGQDITLAVDGNYLGHWVSGNAASLIFFYEVWFKQLEFTKTKFMGEVYVSDRLGKVVAGAKVNVQYSYLPAGANWGEETEGWKNGTSDANGKFAVDIPLVDYDGAWDLNLMVMVEGEKTDDVQNSFALPKGERTFTPDDPRSNYFEIEPQNRDDLDGSVTDQKLELKAYINKTGLAAANIYYFVLNHDYLPGSTQKPIYDHGKVETDDDGRFSITFETRADECQEAELMYKSNISFDDGDLSIKGWRSENDYFWCRGGGPDLEKDDTLSIKVENFGLGQVAQLTGNTKKTIVDGGMSFLVLPIGSRKTFDINDESEDINGGWSRFSRGWFWDPATSGDLVSGEVRVDMVIPEFLPPENYIILVYVLGGEEGYYNYFIVDHEGKLISEDDDDNGGFLPGPGLLMAALATLLVAEVRRRR